jgi:glycosyltransferase involved in cell wall biosynthesis
MSQPAKVLPIVSAIIPAYNAAGFILGAINSVLDQTFTAHEIIIINDGSPDTDDLERILEPYFPKIQYIKQDNQGAAAARNSGLRAANGEYVAFLDADDIWLATFLDEQINFAKSTGADLVYSDALLVGKSPLSGQTFMQVQPSRGAVTPENLLAVNVTVLTSAVLARKKPILDVGLFDPKIRRGHDFELWFRLAKSGARFAYHPKVLAHHRIVESGLSGDTISQLKRTLTVLERIQAREDLTASEKAALEINFNRTLAELALENGKTKLLDEDFAGAVEAFNEARRYRRNWKLTLVSLGVKIAPETVRRIYHRRSTASKTA